MIIYAFAAIILVFIVISISNLIAAPKLRIKQFDKNKEANLPKISTLIPARNEESTIADSLLSAINQTYRNTEIIVLNDKSTDKTEDIVLEIIKKYPQNDIKLYNGTELPDGWLGKNWACHNLSKYASGDILLFIDADISMNKYIVESSLYELQESKSDILTLFPTQITKTFAEKVFIPAFMEWTLTSILPIPLANRLKIPSLSAANGQFIMFTRESYKTFGGHERVKSSIAEDNSIAVISKMEGLKTKIILGNKMIFCRMYTNLNDCISGFTKNYYVLSRMGNVYGYIILNSVFFVTLVLPFIFVFFEPNFIWIILLIILQRTLQSLAIGRDIWQNLVLHIPQIMAILYVAPKSYFAFAKNEIEWKGRIAKVHDEHSELKFTNIKPN